MAEFDLTTQKRISFLSVFAALDEGPDRYDEALHIVGLMVDDGFFSGNSPSQSSGRKPRSGGRGSPSRSSNRGSSGGFSGEMRDPDGPPTDKQIGKVLSLNDDYSWDEVADMSKLEVSNLIEDLLN